MKAFDVWDKARQAGGEYVLGYKETGTHACYMIYGVLAPGESGRLIKPGKGHEELVLAETVDLTVTGAASGTLRAGTAILVTGEDACHLSNDSGREAAYVVAGGHTPQSGHGH